MEFEDAITLCRVKRVGVAFDGVDIAITDPYNDTGVAFDTCFTDDEDVAGLDECWICKDLLSGDLNATGFIPMVETGGCPGKRIDAV